MFQNWIIIRSGFRQHHGVKTNGCVTIDGVLAERYGGNGNRVRLESWDDCPKHTADWIFLQSSKKRPPNVAIFAYSWGCGYGAIRLANELDKLGINVRYMVLCDPVYHGVAIWRALIPRTLFHRIRIAVPPNVKEVFWLRQFTDKPAGHDLVAKSPYTTIHDPVIVKKSHIEMDNSVEFQMLCEEVAAKLIAAK